jgi:hypothetical protein
MDVLRIHPNGRFVAYWDRSKRLRPKDLRALPLLRGRDEWGTPYESELGKFILAHSADPQLHGPSSALGLSSVAKTSRPRAARGSRGISSGGRQRVKDGAYLIQEQARKGTVVLWTCTLPPGTEKDAAAKWSKICHNLRNRLRRKLKLMGLPGEIVYVSEYQRARAGTGGKPVLHLHLLFIGGCSAYKPLLKLEYYRDCWADTVRAATGKDYSAELFKNATRVEFVRKDCGRYLGKYMSKGVQATAEALGSGAGGAHPSSWYGITRALLGRIRNRTSWIRGNEASRAVSFLLANPVATLKYHRWASFSGRDGKEHYVACYGDLRDPPGVRLLIDVLKSG